MAKVFYIIQQVLKTDIKICSSSEQSHIFTIEYQIRDFPIIYLFQFLKQNITFFFSER